MQDQHHVETKIKGRKFRNKMQKKTLIFGMCHKLEELGKGIEVERFPSFSFPSAIVESVYKENYVYSEDTRENNIIDSTCLPSLINQETSECSYLSLTVPQHERL